MAHEDFVKRHGLLSEDQQAAAADVLARLKADDLEVVRVSFADQHGVLRGKTLMADTVASAIDSGVPITSTLLLKDTSHKTVFPVWASDAGFGDGELTGAGDVMMVPDPTTFRVLPWSPGSGWMLCDLYHTDGRPLQFCARRMLRQALARLHTHGLDIVTGLEVEFHVLRLEDPRLAFADTGQPEVPPDTSLVTHGFQYLTEDRYDQLEEIFDLIRRNAVALGLPVRSLEAEFGPSQCEVTFHPAPAMAHADNMMLFRSMVKQVCRRAGLHATFMCRPRFPHAMASGWHLHQSLIDVDSGTNRFIPGDGELLSEIGRQWVAGLLEHAAESCIFSTPTINGYKRYQPFALAPDRIQWGHDNKGAMIRVLSAPGDGASRIENRIGEPAANPYFYMASQILSGVDGIERKLQPPPPVEIPYDADAQALPSDLKAAIECFSKSAFYRERLGDTFVDYLTQIKNCEWQRYLSAVSEWEHSEYFSVF